ncbi:lectin-like [Cyprinodon tularosa]|uniref:lectin-like n=1 Tax=Cyprinodon tularosa TaxID=77115 RepID=UPI0018E1FB7D|nr:lectin-like [Cyprinodon tularosa]
MNWTDAQSYCRRHYTDLASVRHPQENEQIRLQKPAGVVPWIGLYRDTWKWSNGGMYLFHHWASAEPDGGIENCTAADFSLSGRWEDWGCGYKKPFICYSDTTKHVIKVKLVGNSLLNVNEPEVQEKLLEELKQKVEERVAAQDLRADVKLSWRKQPDGTTFYKEEQQN